MSAATREALRTGATLDAHRAREYPWLMDAIRIRCRIDSTTIEIPDLVDFLGRDVEVIVLGERESREEVAERRRQMLGSERDRIVIAADFDQTPASLIEEFEQGDR